MENQEKIFIEQEANNWYRRNKSYLDKRNPEKDYIIDILKEEEIKTANALEIGCANGYRLEGIHRVFGAEVTGIEPSTEALQDGKKKYSAVIFHKGTSANLKIFKDNQFDLIVINFVLHWIDRHKLFKTVSEIDRVLSNGGHLVIGDFFPFSPLKVKYHHLPQLEVYTYKQNYARIFEASEIYTLVSQKIFSLPDMISGDTADEHNRIALWILKKGLPANYAT